MTLSANLGFPRIGVNRELKKAVEAYWAGRVDRDKLISEGAALRARHWALQRDAGIDIVPSNDFSFHDQVLDLTAMVGAVPPRFGYDGGAVDLDLYFAMARGAPQAAAMEMTKWFNTNYHYIVPEFHANQEFTFASRKMVDEFVEAKEAGIHTRPVLLGPVSYLSLGKKKDSGVDEIDLLKRLLPVYAQALGALKKAGADWVQVDEPILVTDLEDWQKLGLQEAYAALSGAGLKVLLTTYFEGLRDNAEFAASLPVDGIHLDLACDPAQLDRMLKLWPRDRLLSLGVVDGRNIWRNDLRRSFSLVAKALSDRGGERLQIAPGCSLLHVPIDLDQEERLDDELKSWLAFARQKLDEVSVLAIAARSDLDAVAGAVEASDAASRTREQSPRIHNQDVARRQAAVSEADISRHSPFETRKKLQAAKLGLPAFPTTTIGSFPQTEDVREARAAFRRGELSQEAYQDFLRRKTDKAVRLQEELDLDVLVHGEFERNDMVEYFGEQMDGFVFTQRGWVQSYGSRCVKPPVIYGDVSRPRPMTVAWSTYAQALTDRPMKGMLTGPVTILQWSFVRDDQPRRQTCQQIALGIRDEVADLEAAGIGIIQIDEPALREGMPLRRKDWSEYLHWAVECFRLASSGVEDETQIHTHMCYSAFNDIMPSIAAMDADVISIETSRSDMDLLDAFLDFDYPNDIGPGIYDIHSPRRPKQDEMLSLLAKAGERLAKERIWINPDCGLKTRRWEEVQPALTDMVAVAAQAREALT